MNNTLNDLAYDTEGMTEEEYWRVMDDANDAARYRWLRHNSGYSIRCSLFGEVGMHEHTDADLDALIDAQLTPNVKFRGAAKRSFDGSPATQG